MEAADLETAISIQRTIISNLQTALTQLADPTIKQYRIDTGQTVEMVDRRDVPRLTDDLWAAYGQLQSLLAMQKGNGLAVRGLC